MDGRDTSFLRPNGSIVSSVGGSSNQPCEQPSGPSTQGEETEDLEALMDDFFGDFDFDAKPDPAFSIDPASEPVSGVDPTTLQSMPLVPNNQQSEHQGSDATVDEESEWDLYLKKTFGDIAQSSTTKGKGRSLEHGNEPISGVDPTTLQSMPWVPNNQQSEHQGSDATADGESEWDLYSKDTFGDIAQSSTIKGKGRSLEYGSPRPQSAQGLSREEERAVVADEGASYSGQLQATPLDETVGARQESPSATTIGPTPKSRPETEILKRAVPHLFGRKKIPKTGQEAAQRKRSHSLVAGSEDAEDLPASKRMKLQGDGLSSGGPTKEKLIPRLPRAQAGTRVPRARPAPRLPPAPSLLRSENRADERLRPGAEAAANQEMPPQERPQMDYRYVRPNNRREYRLVADALLSTRLDFHRKTGFEAPETPEYESYAVQYQILQNATRNVWILGGEPPRLICLDRWTGGLDNWHGLKSFFSRWYALVADPPL